MTELQRRFLDEMVRSGEEAGIYDPPLLDTKGNRITPEYIREALKDICADCADEEQE